MDSKKSKWLVAALATAFVGATAYAADSSISASGTTKDKATSYDTGTTAPFSGAEGVKTTPPASDEDHNDNGGAPGKPHKAHKISKKAKAANDAEHQPTPQPSSSASATGGNSAPAGSDANQQKSTNGQ